jgi:hypothetical protein
MACEHSSRGAQGVAALYQDGEVVETYIWQRFSHALPCHLRPYSERN